MVRGWVISFLDSLPRCMSLELCQASWGLSHFWLSQVRSNRFYFAEQYKGLVM